MAIPNPTNELVVPRGLSLGPLREEAFCFTRNARAPRLRTMEQFAEEEIVLPDGPYKDRRFRVARQPFAGLFFRALDSRTFNRAAVLGPVQSGKTLTACAIPCLYHLFEKQEKVIYGVPDMNMARDKWNEDLLPVIEKSRYRKFLPKSGSGSRGGTKLEYVRFTNGVTLRFMGGAGGDARRSGYTARVVIITEADKFDEAGEASRETDPLKQMEARAEAFGDDKLIIMECTVSIEQGRIWQEYTNGSHSRIALPCPYCGAHVTPEREHFRGWEEADNENDARRLGHFVCPNCETPWEEDDRRDANLNSLLVHDGQSVVRGKVKGDPPPTKTLGFRWSAVNNLFASDETLGVGEWKAQHDENEESAEKERRQFVWSLPYVPDKIDTTPLELKHLLTRLGSQQRGFVPPGTKTIVVTADCGKWLLHWVAWAVKADGSKAIIDYGRKEVASESLGEKQGLLVALKQLADDLKPGWQLLKKTDRGETVEVPQHFSWFFVDSGYQTKTVYDFCRDMGHKDKGFFPIKGYGESTRQRERYFAPKTVDGKKNLYVGDGFHLTLIPAHRIILMHIDADHHKSLVHDALSIPSDEPGAIVLWKTASPQEHTTICQHFLAEKKQQEWIPGRGLVEKWVQEKKNNHFLDTAHIASAGSQFALSQLSKRIA